MSEPKHYWFHIDDSRTEEECKGRSSTWHPFVVKGQYDALAVQLAEAQAQLKFATGDGWNELPLARIEIKTLRAQLKCAVDALNKIDDEPNQMTPFQADEILDMDLQAWTIAREALAEIAKLEAK